MEKEVSTTLRDIIEEVFNQYPGCPTKNGASFNTRQKNSQQIF